MMDRGDLHSDDLLEIPDSKASQKWLEENVWHPFANGTGLIQVHDSFAPKAIGTYNVPSAETFTPQWAVQALSSAAGAIVPFVIAGKASGLAMQAAGESLELRGMAARIATNDTLAQVSGAGLYVLAQKPQEGQSRISNAVGTMAGFGAFAGGNFLLGKTATMLAESSLASSVVNTALSRNLMLGAGRFAVGAAGGLIGYDSTQAIAQLEGSQHKANWAERWQSMAQGGFVNFALPVVQEGASKIIDAYDSRPSGRGIPIDREIKNRNLNKQAEIKDLARENPLARVKRTGTNGDDSHAKINENSVVVAQSDGAAKLAHELSHLSLAKMSEPFYAEIAKIARTDVAAAEHAYYNLRSQIESAARSIENRINNAESTNTAGGAKVIADPKSIGSEIASGGKTYLELWKAEWLQFKDNPLFRPELEHGGVRSFTKSTKAYEKWMDEHIKTVPRDLAEKHAEMSSDPFRFLRGTYYRWAETFPAELPKLQDVPVVNSVGDLHVSQFSAFKDNKKVPIWGVNDFDEAHPLPYTNDLVRLVTSARLLKKTGGLDIGVNDAATAVLEGYTSALKDGGKPIVIAKNPELAKLAKAHTDDPAAFWKKLRSKIKPVEADDVPKDAVKALKSIMPNPDGEMTFGQRQAGVGSLGRQRFVAIQENGKTTFAAEAKSFLPSANYFLDGKDGRSFYLDTAQNGIRAFDPYVQIRNGFVVRNLGPEHTKIELADLSKVADETKLLWSMGYETGNVHLGTKSAAQKILKDLSKRDPDWLANAARKMSDSTIEDWKDWRKASD